MLHFNKGEEIKKKPEKVFFHFCIFEVTYFLLILRSLMNDLSGYLMQRNLQGIFILLRKYYVPNEAQEQTKRVSCIEVLGDNGVRT